MNIKKPNPLVPSLIRNLNFVLYDTRKDNAVREKSLIKA